MNESLFGHLAFSFSKSPENLATEALVFILNRSTVANEAFLHFISQTGASLPPTLNFDTQAGGKDSGVPDIRGRNASGKEILLGEAKFWAGLTDNQPVAYLARLQKSSGSILLFIAPEKRSTLLWAELLRRCKNSNISLHKEEISLIKNIQFDNNSTLALASWRMILNTIRSAVETVGDTKTLSDIMQLEGLCEKMDEEAFLPLRSEELASNIGTRIVQYGYLIDELKDKLVAEKIILKKTTSGGTLGSYVRYTYSFTGEYQFHLHYNAFFWSKYRDTPLWLGLKRPTKPYSSFSPEAKKKLSALEFENPSRLLQDGDELLVPLFLPIGVEKNEVIQSLVSQVREIAEYLT
ncbi:MAG: hypothetical protein DRI32_09185 [Chloroflexi bacterium]|nr:MAG: hypothetical protein DRI32_09185 [Chloroflexota bacterium]